MSSVAFQIAPCPPEASERLAAALGVSRVTADTLVRRGLDDPAAARRFLDLHGPQHDPLLLGDAEEACDLLEAAIGAGTSVVVHGDYDADGVCATAVLTGVLRDLGAVVRPFLPSRFDEGYGLAVDTVERLHADGCGLLVTVDCGITAVEAVERADALGLDVIVTDHHRPAAALPACPLVVPRGHGAYPFPDLCGAGVAWKLGEALVARLDADPSLLDRYLDLVALATVADLVPLVGENRGLVRAGLTELRRGRRPGLAALMQVAGVDRARAGSTQIGFGLAPRLNAAGRMGHPDAALELLTTDDPTRARELAERLDGLNRERQAVEREILDDALAMVDALPEPRRSARGLVLHSEAWHPGVIGIVASRLVERLDRPVVLVAVEGEEGRGSGRSIPAFDLHAALGACSEHLEAYGGHRAAAGVTVRPAALEAFADAFAAHADAVLADVDLRRPERVDAVASLTDVSLDLADELHVLEPFGLGNPGVTLLLPAVELAGLTTLGADRRHLRFAVRSAAGTCRTVHWGAGPALATLAVGGRFDVACRVERNDFNGSSAVQLVARSVAAVPDAVPLDPALCRGGCAGTCADIPADAPEPPSRAVLAVTGRSRVEDRRGGSAVAELVRLAAAGGPLLVICADVDRRLGLLGSVLQPSRFGLSGPLVFTGGCAPAAVEARLERAAASPHLALADHAALCGEPRLAAAFGRVAVLDPPSSAREDAVLRALPAAVVHLVAGRAEEDAAALRRARRAPRALCALAWRLLAAGPGSAAELRARAAAAATPDEPDLAWALHVLVDAGLADIDGGRVSRRTPPPGGVRLEAIPRYAARLLEHEGPPTAAPVAPPGVAARAV